MIGIDGMTGKETEFSTYEEWNSKKMIPLQNSKIKKEKEEYRKSVGERIKTFFVNSKMLNIVDK